MRLRHRTIILTAVGLVALTVAGSVVFYLQSDRFQEKARAELFARIQQATGLRLAMAQFSIDVLRGRFSLSGLELKSPKGFALSIAEASGSFRLAALWRPELELGELNLVRLRMSINPQPGGTGWGLEPVIRRSLSVAARKATVRDSWVEYHNRRIPLDFVLDSLDCDIKYRPNPQSYEVQVSYKNSPLFWLQRKFVYDLRAQLNLLPTGLEIVNFTFRDNKTSFSGSGSLNNWNAPALQVRAAGALAGEDAVLLTPDLKEVRGGVNFVTDVRVDAHQYHLEGKFQGETLSYRTSVTHGITGLFEVQRDLLMLRDVRGRIGDGSFQLEGGIQLRASNRPPNHIKVVARDVVIRDGSGLLDLSSLALENTVDADVVLEWRRGANDFSAEGSVVLHGIPDAAPGEETRTALQGSTDFYYRKDAWYVKKADLASSATTLQITGLDETHARVKLDTNRPAEIFRMVRGFSSSARDLFARRPDWVAISGRYHLDGAFHLRLPDGVDYEGFTSVANGRWRNYTIDSLSGNAFWDLARLQLHSMKLQKGGQSAQGEFWIDTVEGDDYPDFSFDGSLHQISLARLKEFGLDLDDKITGDLNGPHLRVSYSKGVFRGEGSLEVKSGSLNGQPIDSLSATIHLDGDKLSIAGGQIKRGSALVTAEGTADLGTRQMNLSARLRELPLLDIPEAKAKGLDIDGRISAQGVISGTTDQPEVQGSIEIKGLHYGGLDFGTGTAEVNLHQGALAVTKIDFRSDLGAFQGDVRVKTDPGYPGVATLRFSDWNVKKIIAGNASDLFSDLTTALYGSLIIEGPFGDYAKLTYRDGRMNGASFTINHHEFHNDGEIRFSGNTDGVTIERATLIGDGSNLTFDKGGAIPFAANAPMNLRVTGELNLGVLDHISYFPKVGISGAASLNVTVMGSRNAPEIIGTATVKDTRLEFKDMPSLSNLRGNMVFSRDSILLKNVSGDFSSGSITINGSAGVQDASLNAINLQGVLHRVRLHYPKDFVSTIDAELNLGGTRDALTLTGDVSVLHAEYLRDFNLLEQILGGSSGGAGGPTEVSPFANISLNIPVHSRDDGLYIDNELTRVQGGMRLTLRGTVAEPYVTGRVTATEGAIFFRGNRFDIINGSIDFLDRNRINPILNIRAEADVRSYRVRLDVNGDLEHLRSSGLTLTSDPPLSQVDILSLLITGKSGDIGGPTATDNPRRQAEMTGLSAASIISEEMTGAVGKRVERIFGLSTFRVDPFLAGAENDPTARITVSQRLSPDLQVTYSRNLSTSQEQIVLLEYDVTKNLTIVATRDEQGKFGIDFRFRKRIR